MMLMTVHWNQHHLRSTRHAQNIQWHIQVLSDRFLITLNGNANRMKRILQGAYARVIYMRINTYIQTNNTRAYTHTHTTKIESRNLVKNISILKCPKSAPKNLDRGKCEGKRSERQFFCRQRISFFLGFLLLWINYTFSVLCSWAFTKREHTYTYTRTITHWIHLFENLTEKKEAEISFVKIASFQMYVIW